jgi:hypothetical protein
LADEFGDGCQVVRLDDPDLARSLTEAIDYTWQAAEDLRPQLLAAARRQVQLGDVAYRRMYNLIESKRSQPAVPGGTAKELVADNVR